MSDEITETAAQEKTGDDSRVGVEPIVMPFPARAGMDYPEQQELYERAIKLVGEYDDCMSMPTAVGILHQVSRHFEGNGGEK